MPISDPWVDTDEIFDEFGATSQPTDISTAYTRIFGGSPTVGTSWVTPFEGLGKPAISGFSVSTSSTTGGYIEADFTVTTNGLTASVVVQYQENNGSVPDSGSWITEGTYNYSTDGAKNIDFLVPKKNQSYHVQLQYYNDFNDQASSDYLTAPYDTATSSDVATLATPDLSTATLEYASNEGYLSFTYTDDEDAFTVETRVDGSSASTIYDCDNGNVGTANSSIEISVSFGTLPLSTVEFRVKATSTTLNDSAFSSWESATNAPSVPGCPL